MGVSNCEECGVVLGHECSPGYPRFCSVCARFIENIFSEGAKRMTTAGQVHNEMIDKIRMLEKRNVELEESLETLTRQNENLHEIIRDKRARNAELEGYKRMNDIGGDKEECICCGFSANDMRRWKRRAEEQRDKVKERDARIAELEELCNKYEDGLAAAYAMISAALENRAALDETCQGQEEAALNEAKRRNAT